MVSPVESVISLTNEVVGTLPYISPELARGNPDEIDTRSDVYALGVVLYELLTGHYPYPVAGEMAEVLKHIVETPPTPPSRNWSQEKGIRKRSSGRHRLSSSPIDEEIQTVVLKALSKERDRRYQSAGELARDLDRYLKNEPIEAKRDSGWYVLKKTLRRYRGPVIVAAIFVLVLGASTLISYGLYRDAQASTERNRLLYESARKANDRLTMAIKNAGLGPLTAELEEVLGELDQMFLLGRLPVEGGDSLDTPTQIVQEALNASDRGQFAEAMMLLDRALQIDPDDYSANGYKAFILKERYYRRSLGYRDATLLEESLICCDRALATKDTAAGLWNLKCVLLTALGRLEDAEAAGIRGLDADPTYAWVHVNLAKVLAIQCDVEAALDHAQQGVDLAYPSDYPWLILGTLQLHLGQAQAVQSFNEAISIDKSDSRNHMMLARLFLTLHDQADEKSALEEALVAVRNMTLLDPRFHRIAAQAFLANSDFQNAITHAETAIASRDEPSYGYLICAIAHAQLGEHEAARQNIALAQTHWPFDKADVITLAEKGLLWFDTRAELDELLAEAKRLTD